MQRHRVIREQVMLYDNGAVTSTASDVVENTLGKKRYELTNHLGNVLSTISDRKIWNSTDNHYEAVVTSWADYYAGGMLMPGRNGGQLGRYLFNGMEHDGEVSGNGNSYTTEFRQYDPRLGRWKSLDPLMSMFPSMSPYVAFANNPIYFTDPYGLAPVNGGEGGDGGDDPIYEGKLSSEYDFEVVGNKPKDTEIAKNTIAILNGRSDLDGAEEYRRSVRAYQASQRLVKEKRNDYTTDNHYRNYKTYGWARYDPANVKFNKSRVIPLPRPFDAIVEVFVSAENRIKKENQHSKKGDSYAPKKAPAQTDLFDGNVNPETSDGKVDETVGGGDNGTTPPIKQVDQRKVYEFTDRWKYNEDAVYPRDSSHSIRWEVNKDIIDTVLIYRKVIIDTVIFHYWPIKIQINQFVV